MNATNARRATSGIAANSVNVLLLSKVLCELLGPWLDPTVAAACAKTLTVELDERWDTMPVAVIVAMPDCDKTMVWLKVPAASAATCVGCPCRDESGRLDHVARLLDRPSGLRLRSVRNRKIDWLAAGESTTRHRHVPADGHAAG